MRKLLNQYAQWGTLLNFLMYWTVEMKPEDRTLFSTTFFSFSNQDGAMVFRRLWWSSLCILMIFNMYCNYFKTYCNFKDRLLLTIPVYSAVRLPGHI